MSKHFLAAYPFSLGIPQLAPTDRFPFRLPNRFPFRLPIPAAKHGIFVISNLREVLAKNAHGSDMQNLTIASRGKNFYPVDTSGPARGGGPTRDGQEAWLAAGRLRSTAGTDQLGRAWLTSKDDKHHPLTCIF
jgi:hypothetical protein